MTARAKKASELKDDLELCQKLRDRRKEVEKLVSQEPISPEQQARLAGELSELCQTINYLEGGEQRLQLYAGLRTAPLTEPDAIVVAVQDFAQQVKKALSDAADRLTQATDAFSKTTEQLAHAIAALAQVVQSAQARDAGKADHK